MALTDNFQNVWVTKIIDFTTVRQNFHTQVTCIHHIFNNNPPTTVKIISHHLLLASTTFNIIIYIPPPATCIHNFYNNKPPTSTTIMRIGLLVWYWKTHVWFLCCCFFFGQNSNLQSLAWHYEGKLNHYSLWYTWTSQGHSSYP